MTKEPGGVRMPETDVLRIEQRGPVLLVTMNRPNQRNALNVELRNALRETFDAFDAHPELRCAVLTGNGSAFCAGADLKEMAATRMAVPGEDSVLLLGSRGRVSKPVIAAVNGYAVAGGFLLAQNCDLCIASEEARFGIAEVKVGRGSPWAVPLISLLPRRIMMELLLTGEPVDARRAYEVGLANRVVAGSELVDTALAMAGTIAANAPLSVRAAKQMVEVATEVGETQALRTADLIYHRVYTSDDAQEGPRAFAEKRDPVWTGR